MNKAREFKALHRLGDTRKLRRARLLRPIRGAFSSYKEGDLVEAWHIKGSGYGIERLVWRKPWVALSNLCVGIPRKALEFL